MISENRKENHEKMSFKYLKINGNKYNNKQTYNRLISNIFNFITNRCNINITTFT